MMIVKPVFPFTRHSIGRRWQVRALHSLDKGSHRYVIFRSRKNDLGSVQEVRSMCRAPSERKFRIIGQPYDV